MNKPGGVNRRGLLRMLGAGALSVLLGRAAGQEEVAAASDAVGRDEALQVPYVRPATLTGQTISQPRIVTLIGGQEDEHPIAVQCTIEADTTNFKIGNRGWKMSMSGPAIAQARFDYPGISPPTAAAIGYSVYLADASLIRSVQINLYQSASYGNADMWGAATAADLVDGWNFIRWPATESVRRPNWPTIHRVRIVVVTTGATDVTIGHAWLECPEKAQLLFINDGGYKTFLTTAYRDLRARAVPVTWAVDCTILGTGVGSAERISESDLAVVSKENANAVSFHGYDGGPTSGMSAEQIRVDTMSAIKWLQQRGYWKGAFWRAAYVQNRAPNASAAESLILASATPNDHYGVTVWPFQRRYDVPRIALHSLTQAGIDSMFTTLRDTHQLALVYMHAIDARGNENVTMENWNYFARELSGAMAAGWLEAVTLDNLMARSGWRFRRGFGTTVIEYPDLDGTPVEEVLP